MAKIQNGALTDKLQGRVGPVVFNWTRFGQVVKSFAHPPLNTTPAATETKTTFAHAARVWGVYRKSQPFLALGLIAEQAGRAPQGPFVAAYMHWMRGQPFTTPTAGGGAQLLIDGSRQVGGHWQFHCQVSPNLAASAFGLVTASKGESPTSWGGVILNFDPDGWSSSLTRTPDASFDVIGIAALYDDVLHDPPIAIGGAVSFWHEAV